jgi:hypothetical protein
VLTGLGEVFETFFLFARRLREGRERFDGAALSPEREACRGAVAAAEDLTR